MIKLKQLNKQKSLYINQNNKLNKKMAFMWNHKKKLIRKTLISDKTLKTLIMKNHTMNFFKFKKYIYKMDTKMISCTSHKSSNSQAYHKANSK